MAEPEAAAGTPETPPDDGTPTGAGTPGTETDDGTAGQPSETDEAARLREENQRLAQANSQLLGEKSKFEQTSRENQELRARLQAGGTVPPGTPDLRAQMAQQLQNDYAIIHDPRYSAEDRLAANARITDANIQYTRYMEQENAFNRELLSVPLEDRAEVEQRARAHGVMPSWALRDLKAERFDKIGATPTPTATPTTPAPPRRDTHLTRVPAAAIRDSGYTEEQYDRWVADAGPPKYDKEARKKIDEIDRGILKPRAG